MVRIGSLRPRSGPGQDESQLSRGSGLRSKAFTVSTYGRPTARLFTDISAGGGLAAPPAEPSRMVVSAAEILTTWVAGNSAWQRIDASNARWEYGKLPFPFTPCITLRIGGAQSSTGNPATQDRSIRIRVNGLDQFGNPVSSMSPEIRLLDIGLANHHINYIWTEVVFSEILSVEWMTSGPAPVNRTVVAYAKMDVGMVFTWKTSTAFTNVVDPNGNILQSNYFFPANQGIGTQMRLVGDRGTPTRRYPELSLTVRTPTGDVAGTFFIPPHTTPTLTKQSGFYMGFTPTTEWLVPTDTLTGLPYSAWVNAELNKFRLEDVGDGFLANDGTTLLNYITLAAASPASGQAKLDNPASLIYDVQVSTRIGVKSGSVTTSVTGNS